MTSVILFFATALMFSPSIPQRAVKVELQRQIKLHSSYFSQGRYDQMWEMSSKRFKDSNENNKERYVSDMQKYGIGRAKTKILNMRVVRGQARVTLRLSVWSNQDKKWLREVVHDQWVFEDGHWVFDNQLPAHQRSRR